MERRKSTNQNIKMINLRTYKQKIFMRLTYALLFLMVLVIACSKEEDDDNPPAKKPDPSCFEVPAYTNQLPNMDFETWGYPDSSEGKYIEPCGGVWASSNAVSQSILSISTSVRTNQSGNGDFAVQLETQNLFGVAAFPGVFFSGRFKSYNFSGLDVLNNAEFGVPFTEKPLKFKGLHKYISVAGDSAYIIVMLSKYDTINKVKDTVGLGDLTIKNSITDYSEFNIDIDYSYPAGSEIPDSVLLLFTSSKALEEILGGAGSTLTVDNCSFVY